MLSLIKRTLMFRVSPGLMLTVGGTSSRCSTDGSTISLSSDWLLPLICGDARSLHWLPVACQGKLKYGKLKTASRTSATTAIPCVTGSDALKLSQYRRARYIMAPNGFGGPIAYCTHGAIRRAASSAAGDSNHVGAPCLRNHVYCRR